MEKTKDKASETEFISQCLNDMNALFNSKIKKEDEKLIAKLVKSKDKLLKSGIPENIVRSGIISYIIKYFGKELDKVKKSKEITTLFCQVFSQKEVVQQCLNIINTRFSTPSIYKAVTTFRKNISEEKKHLEIYFKLILITQNIGDIIEGIHVLLNIKNQNIENIFKRANFNNPYSIIIIRDLINELIEKDISQIDEEILQNVIQNMKITYLFHCPNCFGILYSKYTDNKKITCVKHQNINVNNLNELKSLLDFNINCKGCNQRIEIYENNFKCSDCYKFFCEKCAKKHEKENIKNRFINIYEIGYICEEHYELYNSYCRFCKINLCKKCKEIHKHCVDKSLIDIDEKLVEEYSNKDLNGINNINKFISFKLSILYKYMQNFGFKNLYIKLSIFFQQEKQIGDEVDIKKVLFKKFFDEDFKKYYKKLLEKVSEGKHAYHNLLNEIKQEYENNKIDIEPSFYYCETNYQEIRFTRSININNWNSSIKEIINWFKYNYDKMEFNGELINIYNISLKLKNDIELYKIKILAFLKSNEIYSSYLMKLINRYLSDFLLRKLIEKYSSHFDEVQVTYKNFYEIAFNFRDALFKNDNFKKNTNNINIDLEDIFNEKNMEKKKEKIQSLLISIKDNNEIIFKSSIVTKNDNISKDELNFVLDSFFYFKSQGNIIAHSNISPKDSIKLKEIDKNIPNIENYMNGINNIDKSNKNYFSNNININGNINSNINSIEETNNINNFGDTKFNIKTNSDNKINPEIDVKKIINSILENKCDWLDLKEEVEKEINLLIPEIKSQILNDFAETSLNKKIKINDIIDFIFKKKFDKIFTSDDVFTRGLSQSIDDLVKREETSMEFSSYKNLGYYLGEMKEKIDNIDNYINKFKKFKIEINDKIYHNMKMYINNYLKDVFQRNSNKRRAYSQIINDLMEKDIPTKNLDDFEKKAFIISLIIPEIKSKEDSNLENYINRLYKVFKEYFVLYNVSIKIKGFYEEIKRKIKTQDEGDIFSKIKNFRNKKSNDVNMDYDRMSDILTKLFKDRDIEWTKQLKSDVSLESLLFYFQNK